MKVLELDDVLRLETFDGYFGSQFDIDPSGKILAFSLHQCAEAAYRYGPDFLAGGDRGQVCLVDLKSKTLQRVDMADGMGLFSPLWSPDGQWIAVAVTDGSFVRPAVVASVSKELRILSNRNLTLEPEKHPFRWLSGDELVCDLLPDGILPMALDVEWRGVRKAISMWPKEWERRRTVTANALRTDQLAEPEPVGELCILTASDALLRPYFTDVSERTAAFGGKNAVDLAGEPESPDIRLPRDSKRVAVHEASGQAIYLCHCDDATRIVALNAQDASTIFETNTHLAPVIPGRVRRLSFKMPQGGTNAVICILPPDYQEGEKRPAVMWIYPGMKAADDTDFGINNADFLNLQLLAAQGYVVLIPAIPLLEELPEIIDSVANAVLPAIDVAAKAGLIDETNVHVFGLSWGGWAVLALLTETQAFKSGIAMAASTNLISDCGQFDVRFRYDDRFGTYMNHSEMCERVWRLPGPPWEHVDRYVRNSPLFAVKKISVPVLMLHGDQDFISIAQAEEMFSALRRAGKTAEFIRYWGEGHILSSPANIKDAWSRIFNWLNDLSPLP